MTQRIVECVPNFSEGRDLAKLKLITDAIEGVTGVELLDVDPGADTNRTVVTFVGDPQAVLEAAFLSVKRAFEVLDMRRHTGAHPRLGACDVCPFVPVEGVSMDECVRLARALGERVGRELGVPVYLYERAASRPARGNLATVRKGEYEGLEDKLKDPEWTPDFGPATFVPAFGALITGAREFLIAYNVTLNSRDKAHATDIAMELREKGRVARRGQTNAFYSSGQELRYAEGHYPCGNCARDLGSLDDLAAHCREAHGYDLRQLLAANDVDVAQGLVGQKVYRAGLFAECKAIGWYVNTYKRAQISINLTDYQETSLVDVLEAARELAAARGLVVTGSEVVGLVPFQALYEAGRFYLRRQGKSFFVPVADVLETAVFSMGLNDVAPFDIDKKVLGLPKRRARALAGLSCADFADEVSRDTPAPGGGSVAALAGALGAALAAMVANLTHAKAEAAQAPALLSAAEKAQRAKDALLLAVDEDASAFNAYMEARRLPKGTQEERATREVAMQRGLKSAVDVPWATASASLEAMETAAAVIEHGLAASISDGLVGLQVAFAGVRGGVWNVLANLKDIADETYCSEKRSACAKLLDEARSLLDRALAMGETRLAETQRR